MSYPEIVDPVRVPNDNSNALISICTDEHMLVLNNLKTNYNHFKSKLTYKQGQTWISELDSCLASLNLVSCVSDILVSQNLALPSDLAPMSISIRAPSVSLDHLAARASQLGDHDVLHNPVTNRLAKCFVSYGTVDVIKLQQESARREPPVVCGDVDVSASNISSVLYECVQQARRANRWQQLLKDDNHARIWQTVNWKGEVSQASHSPYDITQPSDVDFQIHFNEIFNPPDVQRPDINDLVSTIHIPVMDDPISPREVEDQVHRIKAGKACGPDGVPPGVLCCLRRGY